MGAEKFIFAFLVCLVVAIAAFFALGAAPKQPVAFFAYGANLGKQTMASRAGGFINATAAELPDYSFAFASQDARPAEFGVATPVHETGASVNGALYYLTPEQMASLDKLSGVPNFYERRVVKVALPDGSSADAFAYFLSGSTHAAAPSRIYYLAALEGMKEWGYGTGALDAAVPTN